MLPPLALAALIALAVWMVQRDTQPRRYTYLTR